MRRIAWAIALLSLLLSLLLLLLWRAMERAPPARLRARAGWRADVVLVPSGDFENRRTLRAVQLVLKGRASAMLISGQGYGGDSSAYLGRVARKAGLPQEALHLEPSATSTLLNMRLSRPILEKLGARRVLVVTSRRHAFRAALVAERALAPMEVQVETVPDAQRSGASLQEALKTIAYCGAGWLSCVDILRGED